MRPPLGHQCDGWSLSDLPSPRKPIRCKMKSGTPPISGRAELGVGTGSQGKDLRQSGKNRVGTAGLRRLGKVPT